MREFWFVADDSVRLFAVEDGAGRAVVMLHGGLANHLVSLRLTAALAPQFRVIAPDLRSSGKSGDGSPLTWDRLAEDVARLMDHLGVERAVVGGVSSGSGVAVRFALRFPGRLAGLVLVTPLYGGADCGLSEHQAATFRRMDEVGRRAPHEGVQVLRPLYDPLPPPVRERALAMVEGFDAKSVAATTHFLATGDQPFSSASELRSIAAPTLLLSGHDALHPADVTERYAAHLPSCTVVREQDANISAVIDAFCREAATW
jgi:pimeloyl-ACP methyl ester carboxylesterase